MSKEAILSSLEELRESLDEFRFSMERLHQQNLALNARVGSFQRNSAHLDEKVAKLRRQTQTLSDIADLARRKAS